MRINARVMSAVRGQVRKGQRLMRAYHCALLALLVGGCCGQPAVTQTKSSIEPATEGSKPLQGTTRQLEWNSGQRGTFVFLRFSPQDKHLVASLAPFEKNGEWQIVVLNVETSQELYSVASRVPSATCLSPDESRLIVLAADSLTIHDIPNRQVSVRIDRKLLGPEIQSVGINADGSIVVGACETFEPGRKRLAWTIETGEATDVPAEPLTWHGRGLSPDGCMFFSGGWPGPTPRIYKSDLSDRITYCFRKEWPNAAGFTPDSKRFVTIHEDGMLVVWAIEALDDNAEQLLTQGGFDDCLAFAVSHDLERIATAEKDSSIQIRPFSIPR